MNFSVMTASVLDRANGTFGSDVTYTPKTGSAYPIRGVFANAEIEIHTGDGPAISRLAPTLGVKLSDLAAKPTSGDQVTIAAVVYDIIDSQPDGFGGSRLILQAAI
jgi:hypothetical protein